MRAYVVLALTASIALVSSLNVVRAGEPDGSEDVKKFIAQVTRIEKPTKLLPMLVALGMIQKPTWKEAEIIHRRTSGDLGERSASFNVRGIKSVECVVLISKSSEETENPTVTALTIQTPEKLFTYHLKEKGYVLAFESDRTKRDSEERKAVDPPR